MSDNMRLYNALRTPPPEALKPISAGRLKGKTDINPMWRIKALTEQFGPCGIGWYIDHVAVTTLDAEGSREVVCMVELDLYVRVEDKWSAPIHGIGGNKLAVMEQKGLYVDDDAMKKAYSDAIGIACKALGMGGDVYYEKDASSKYDAGANPPAESRADGGANRARKPAKSDAMTAKQAADEAKLLRARKDELHKLAMKYGVEDKGISSIMKALEEEGRIRIKKLYAYSPDEYHDLFVCIEQQLTDLAYTACESP